MAKPLFFRLYITRPILVRALTLQAKWPCAKKGLATRFPTRAFRSLFLNLVSVIELFKQIIPISALMLLWIQEVPHYVIISTGCYK